MKELFVSQKLIMLILTALLILVGTNLSSAQEQEVTDELIRKLVDDELPNPILNAEQIYDKAIRSTVLIIREAHYMGSGVLIDRKLKLAITNKHVVGNQKSVRVFFPARNKDGQLINKLRPNNHLTEFYLNEGYGEVLTELGYATEGNVIHKSPDPEIDLAIIEIKGMPETAEAIDFASIDFNLAASPHVHIIGHPESRTLWHYDSGKFKEYYDRDLHIEGSIWFGNSGGPVLNEWGKLVGIIWGGDRDRPMVSFAVPLEDIRGLRSELKSIQSGKIENGTNSTITYEMQAAEDSKWQEFTIDGVRWREVQLNPLEKIIIEYPRNQKYWAKLEGIELVGSELIEFPPGYPKIRFSENNNDKKKVLVLETNIQSFRNDNSNGSAQGVSRSNDVTYHFSYDSKKETVSLETGLSPRKFYHIPAIIIQNVTDSTINYAVQWREDKPWQEFTIDGVRWREVPVDAPRSNRHWPDLDGVELAGSKLIEFPPGYPKIRLNEIKNDQKTDTKIQTLKTSNSYTSNSYTLSSDNLNRGFSSDAYAYHFGYDNKKKIYLREGLPARTSDESPNKTMIGWINWVLNVKNPYFYVFLVFLGVLFVVFQIIIVDRFPKKRHIFSLKNNTEFPIDFDVKWVKQGNWSKNSLGSGALWTDWQPGFSKKSPQLRFNDGKETQEHMLKTHSRRFGRHADDKVSREDGRKYHFEYDSEAEKLNFCESE